MLSEVLYLILVQRLAPVLDGVYSLRCKKAARSGSSWNFLEGIVLFRLY